MSLYAVLCNQLIVIQNYDASRSEFLFIFLIRRFVLHCIHRCTMHGDVSMCDGPNGHKTAVHNILLAMYISETLKQQRRTVYVCWRGWHESFIPAPARRRDHTSRMMDRRRWRLLTCCIKHLQTCCAQPAMRRRRRSLTNGAANSSLHLHTPIGWL